MSFVKSEAKGFEIADVSSVDYERRSDDETFGLLLTESATLEIKMIDGTSELITYPEGWNPIAGVKILAAGATVTTIQVYY